MERQEFYHCIDLPPYAMERLDQASRELDLEALAPWLDRLLDGRSAPTAYRELKERLEDTPDHWNMLYCHLECARRAYAGYQKRGISDVIYIDTMRCFSRFLWECQREQGRMFFDRAWWTFRQTSMTLFRVGTLEYELSTCQGEPALAIHIPSDADLSREGVDASLVLAEIFFKTFFQDFPYEQYICNSWLLSPALRPLLGPDSHILSFQRRFQILRERPEDREFIQWLFQSPQDTAVDRLPAATSLQKKVKALLLEGGTVGCAYGIMQWDL